MKQSPDMRKLEEMLRSSKLAGGGFLGQDARAVAEIIECDLAELARLGHTTDQLALRMRELTDVSTPLFGIFMTVDENLEVATDESRGLIVCPWPHPADFRKTVTTARRTDSGEVVRWSTLSIHMIESHSFFQGRGSTFRIEPAKLIRVIFPHSAAGGYKHQA